MAKLTYEIEMTPANAGIIDAINKILLGDSYVEETPTKPSSSKPSPKEAEGTSDGITLRDIQNAAKASKAEFGEEFTMQVLKDLGVKVKATLGRSTSAIEESQYEEVIKLWKAGPSEEELDDEDDDLGSDDDLDEEDEAEVSADTVKDALRAYSKEVGRDEAKAIMTKYGAAALSKVDDLPVKKLTAMLKELS